MARSATARHRGTIVVLVATFVAMGTPPQGLAIVNHTERSRELSEIEMKNTYLELPSHSLASRTIALTTVAMVAFAANSVLCRLAFTSGSIDPATFALVRLSSGTVMLWVIWLVIKRGGQVRGSWSAAMALFAYASAFSFAYISLPAELEHFSFSGRSRRRWL
jgi:hypothetical protein